MELSKKFLIEIKEKQNSIEILKDKDIENIKSIYFLKIKEYFRESENRIVE